MSAPQKHVYLIPSDSDEEMPGAYYNAFTEPPWMTHLLSDADLAAGPRIGVREEEGPHVPLRGDTQPLANEALPDAGAALPPVAAAVAQPAASPQRKRSRAARGENGNPRGVLHFGTYNERDGDLADFATNVEKRNLFCPLRSEFQYIEYVLERGTHTHLHICIRTKARMTETAVKKCLPYLQGIHFGDDDGRTFGTIDTMLAYIRKHDDTYVAGPWALGEPPRAEQKQGHRSDLDALAATLLRTRDLHACAVEHTQMCIRYAAGLEKTHALLKPPPPVERPMDLMWIHGPTRQGKTTLAYEISMERFQCTPYEPPVAKDGEAEHTFDEYDGNKVLFLDEFDYRRWNINLLKKLFDKFRVQLNCRYRNKYAEWELVIICTNCSPAECWAEPGNKYNPADVRAIFARVGLNVYYKERKEQKLADCARWPQFNPDDGTMIVQL